VTSLAVAEAAVEKFSADFLTERLRASGVLPRGRVIAIDAGERRSTIVSTIAPLRVEYSSEAPEGASVCGRITGCRSSVTWRFRFGSRRSGFLLRSGGPIFTASLPLSRIWTAPRFWRDGYRRDSAR